MFRRLFLLIALFIVTYLYINNPLFEFTGGAESIRWLYVLFPLALVAYPTMFQGYLKEARPFVIVYALIIIYLTVIMLVGGEARYYTKSVAAAIEDVLLPFVFVAFFYKLRITEKLFITFLLVFASVCALISFLCIINSSIASFFRDSVAIGNDYLDTHLYRGFGLSYSLTYAYGISLGVLLVAGIYYINDNKWFIVALPFILISIFLNARTGIVVAFVGFAIQLFLRRKSNSFVLSIILFVFLLFGFSRLVSNADISDASLTFMEDFVNAFLGLATGDDAGSISVLRSQWQLPGNISEWIVGRGVDIYKETSLDYHSDIGFFIQLNYGGLIYLCLLLVLVSKVARFFFQKKDLFWGYFFITTFLIANYKGQFLLASGCFRLFIMIMAFYIYNNIVQKQEKAKLYTLER